MGATKERDYSTWPPARPSGEELTVIVKRRRKTCKGWGEVGTGRAMMEPDSEPSPITRPCPNFHCAKGVVAQTLTGERAAAALADPEQLEEEASYRLEQVTARNRVPGVLMRAGRLRRCPSPTSSR